VSLSAIRAYSRTFINKCLLTLLRLHTSEQGSRSESLKSKKKKSDGKTTTPKREAILEKAVEMWRLDQIKHGCGQLAEITPEYTELAESGFIQTAQSELMRSTKSVNEEWQSYSEQTEKFADFSINVSEVLANGLYTCGTRGCGKSDLNMMLAEKLMAENVIVLTFDPSRDWIQRSNIRKYVTVQSYMDIKIPVESQIYDLSLVTIEEQKRFVERFNRALFDYQISHGTQWYFLIFEEAHQFYPQGVLRRKEMAYSVRLLTQGRNFRISMALVTQFSSLLDKGTMKFMTQRFFGCHNEPNDIKYLRGFLGKQAEKLSNLNSGEFIFYDKGKLSTVTIQPYECGHIDRIPIVADMPTFAQPVKTLPKTDNTEFLRSLVLSALLIGGIAYGLSQML
jgi:hypothetical protein